MKNPCMQHSNSIMILMHRHLRPAQGRESAVQDEVDMGGKMAEIDDLWEAVP